MKKLFRIIAVSVSLITVLFATGCGKNLDKLNKEGESTVIEETKNTTPKDYSPKENLYIAAGKAIKNASYTYTASGSIIAKKSFIKYTQKVEEKFWKLNGELLCQSLTKSPIVKSGYQTFISGEEVAIRAVDDVNAPTWEEKFECTTKMEFGVKYGVFPEDITNYILNDDTITLAELTQENEGTFTFRFEVDTQTATVAYKIKMLRYGDLAEYPNFETCSFTLVIDDEWNVLSVKTSDVYTVKYAIIGTVKCTSEIERIYGVAPESIPEKDIFTAALEI